MNVPSVASALIVLLAFGFHDVGGTAVLVEIAAPRLRVTPPMVVKLPPA
jgi:hypothetical protein